MSTRNNLAEDAGKSKAGFFSRLKQGLTKTRSQLGQGIGDLVLGEKVIDEALLEEIETLLLSSDLGMAVTEEIIDHLSARVKRNQLGNADVLIQHLKEDLEAILKPCDKELVIDKQQSPFVILTVGVNGAGKTTTIGKLAGRLKDQGYSVMLAAGDTFRAAAVEQLKVWGERNEIPVIAQQSGADSASVIYDALESAKARKIDVLIADTAGRLQNKDNLMEELKKIARVMSKADGDAPHEVMLVIDAGTGQNALQQAKLFQECVNVTGIVLTKLDGTAKGGIIFAIAKQLNIPIRFIGVGEQTQDLQPFNAKEFVSALMARG